MNFEDVVGMFGLILVIGCGLCLVGLVVFGLFILSPWAGIIGLLLAGMTIGGILISAAGY